MLWTNVAPGLLVLDEYSTWAVVYLGLIYGVDLLLVIMFYESGIVISLGALPSALDV
jgi:hypothetical protein